MSPLPGFLLSTAVADLARRHSTQAAWGKLQIASRDGEPELVANNYELGVLIPSEPVIFQILARSSLTSPRFTYSPWKLGTRPREQGQRARYLQAPSDEGKRLTAASPPANPSSPLFSPVLAERCTLDAGNVPL